MNLLEAPRAAEPLGPVELDRAECLWLVASRTVGRVVFTAAALPAAEPIGYLLDDEEILFRSAVGGRLSAATRDTVVGFQTDDIDPCTLTGWSVSGVGEAYEVVEPIRLAELTEGIAAPGTQLMCIPLQQLTGYRYRGARPPGSTPG
jgi:uncharacterized protein